MSDNNVAVRAVQPEEERAAAFGGLLNEVSLDFAARGENVALARSLVAALVANCREPVWDITVSMLEEIKVAVSEAVSNAIIHGYANAAKQNVRMHLWQYKYAFVICIIDEGVGIADVKCAMEPDFTTGAEHLGLGFAFMNSFMDEVLVDSAPGRGTRVTLIKRLAEPLRKV
ncbi:MAG: anti-sigma F factor [Firmicutes bacterium]|nr:anti-sigma F factor [Bacillota bacterium]